MRRMLALLILLMMAAPAWAATINSLQTGTITVAANSASNTGTITPVNMSKSILIGSYTSSANTPDTFSTALQLSNTTTVTATRVTSTGAAEITLRYQVAEIEGISVQRGQATVNAIPVDVTISSVNTAKSFVIFSLKNSGGSTSDDDFTRAELTSSTNLRLTTVNAVGNTVVYWQVVEWTDSSAQHGTLSFGTGDASLNATISSVDTGKTLVRWSYSSASGTVADIGQKGIGCVLASSTTVTCSRSNTGQAMTVAWSVVAFTDSTTVQRGDESFGTSDTQRDVTISSVATTRSVIFGGGFNGASGRSTYTADDVMGVQMGDMQLTSATNLRLTRAITGSVSATLPWQVVTLAATPPPPPPQAIMQFTSAATPNQSVFWDANTESDLAGYKLFFGTSPGIYSVVIDLGLDVDGSPPRFVGAPPGTYTAYFAAKAYDASGNLSGFSSELSAVISVGETGGFSRRGAHGRR